MDVTGGIGKKRGEPEREGMGGDRNLHEYWEQRDVTGG
jgi:hypothetical protein